MNILLPVIALSLAWASPLLADIKVATLHPLLADLAEQVGGDNVEVVNLLQPGSDIHHFEPSPKTLATMRGAQLVLASGKGLEPYLDKLRDSLESGCEIIEVGAKIPSIALPEDGDDDHHHHGAVDPHWWHSAENMKRAARIVADAFGKADAANQKAYRERAATAAKQFGQLKTWAQKQILQIPAADRKLVTAHAAFGYFSKEFGFESMSILGIGRGDEASARHIAEIIRFIRNNNITAVFVEDQANPKVMEAIVKGTGVKLGRALIADGTAVEAHTFETMLKHNVTSIVEAMKP